MRDEKLIELLEKIRNHCVNTHMELELLWPQLIMKNHLRQDEKDLIYSNQNITSTAKKMKMFGLLQSKDEKVFQTLHDLFKSYGWKEALDILVEGLHGTQYGYLIGEDTKSSPRLHTGSKGVNNKPKPATVPEEPKPHLEPLPTESFAIVNEKTIKENEQFYAALLPLCKVVPQTCGIIQDLSIDGKIFNNDGAEPVRLPKGLNMKESYRNFSNPKGLALIINNENFTLNPKRIGTEVDEINMKNLLKQLNYEVVIKKDLSAKEMMQTMKDFAKRQEHCYWDSTVVVVLTHGSSGFLCGVDEEKVAVDDFVRSLNRDGCPALNNKPKLFFIQACRGKNHDRGLIATDYQGNYSQDEVDELLKRIPADADMFIGYSTTPGYVSWRNSKTGTWFIQAICQVIMKHAQDEHILEIFTRVHQLVATNLAHVQSICAADCRGNCTGKCKRVQMAESTYRLMKKFYFFPGL